MINIMNKSLYGFLMVAIVTTATAGELKSPKESDIDAVVEALVHEQKGVGTAVFVLKNGAPLFMKGYGWANLEHMVPVTPDTIFQSGSMGKMFTASVIMMLIRDGKVSLDDTLSKFFPKGPDFWQQVTIRHLLSHRGGIRGILEPGGARELDMPQNQKKAMALFYLEMRKEYTEEEYAKLVASAKKTYEPGTDYIYSNEGYVLLGIIIRKITGKFHGDYLKENLLSKIGMATSQINVNDQIIQNRAQSYEIMEGSLIHAPYVSHFYNQTADGTLLFNLKDLVKWEQALIQGTFLSKKYLNQMYQAAPFPDGTIGLSNYGYGWRSRYIRGHLVVEHGGAWQGFRTHLSRYRDDGLTIAVLSNTGHAQPDKIVDAIAGLFNPDYGPYHALADQTTARNMRKVTSDYLNGKIDRTLFGMAAYHLLSTAQIDRVRKKIKLDINTDFILVDIHSAGQKTVYTYRISEKSGGRSYVIYDIEKNGKIAKISFQLR